MKRVLPLAVGLAVLAVPGAAVAATPRGSVAAVAIAPALTTSVASGVTVTVTTPQSLTINGHTYGPEDGLVVTTYDTAMPSTSTGTTLESAAPSSTSAPEIYPNQSREYDYGSSYAKTTESHQIRYTGVAHAAGNVYTGKRYIEVCFSYTRGSKTLGKGKQCSSAYADANSWTAGASVTDTVTDNIIPFTPSTTFHYNTVTINP